MTPTESARRRRRAGAVVAAAALVALASVGLWTTLTGSSDAQSTNAEAGPSTSAAAARGGQVTATPSADASADPSADASASPSADGATAAEWSRCISELKAAENTLAAARRAADHWGAHLGAQVSFDKDEITSAQARAIWAKTKAPGREDVRLYRQAKAGYDTDRGACAAAAALEPAGSSQQSAACLSRAESQSVAVNAADKVVDDWEGHLDEMDTEAHDKAYLKRWAQKVKNAPKAIDAFDAATAAAASSPACTPPTASG